MDSKFGIRFYLKKASILIYVLVRALWMAPLVAEVSKKVLFMKIEKPFSGKIRKTDEK